MQKSNDLLGKKLKEAKKASFSKALGITKNNQKKEINKITTTPSINIEIKHFIVNIYPKSVSGKLTIKQQSEVFYFSLIYHKLLSR